MNTRSKSNKVEVDNFYKAAIENQGKTNSRNPTLRTSTSTEFFKPKSIDFLLNNSIIAKDQSEIFVDTLEPASDDSGGVTIQPVCETKFIPTKLTKINKFTMANQNPFATLKYVMEAVPFFDSQNISLSYFVEKAKSMLPAEAESQFTKIIRTRIVSEAYVPYKIKSSTV